MLDAILKVIEYYLVKKIYGNLQTNKIEVYNQENASNKLFRRVLTFSVILLSQKLQFVLT